MALTAAERQQRYRQRHPEKVRAAIRDWERRNPERHALIRRRAVNKYYARVKDVPAFIAKRRAKGESYRTTVQGVAMYLWANAKRRASHHCVGFELTVDVVEQMVTQGKCSVSGIPFVITKRNGPWSPSLDRIDPSCGYTISNTRVVVWLYNAAKQEYGDTDVLILAKALVERLTANGIDS